MHLAQAMHEREREEMLISQQLAVEESEVLESVDVFESGDAESGQLIAAKAVVNDEFGQAAALRDDFQGAKRVLADLQLAQRLLHRRQYVAGKGRGWGRGEEEEEMKTMTGTKKSEADRNHLCQNCFQEISKKHVQCCR